MDPHLKKLRLETGIFFSYFVVSLLVLYPLIPHLFSRLPFAANGDIRLTLTILFSNLKKISQGDFLNLFQLPILFPLSHTLTAGASLFGQTLLVLPFYLVRVRNVYIIYNLLTFFAYMAAGYCAYRFVREWVVERWLAWLAGALYILLPFRVQNIPHLNLMFNFPIPLAFLFFSRFLKTRRVKDLVFFFLSFFSQFLFDLSLGLYLAIALAIFFLIQQILFGWLPPRSWLHLAVAAALFVIALAIIFHPYLNPNTSLSTVDEIHSIPPDFFRNPLSFYCNWSSLLVLLKRIFWSQFPGSPGITLFIFFMLAFAPYLEGRLQRVMALTGSFFLIAPALALPIINRGLPFHTLNLICGWTLLLFFISLSLLLFLIRKQAPRELLLLTLTWMFLQFSSSQVSLPIFNLFQGLARVFPFLHRSRGIRTEYILMLLFFAVSAFGFSYFFRRWRRKKTLLALMLLLVFAERIRWPVSSGRLQDDLPGYKTAYHSLSLYPDHFGLLELPFDPKEPNHYSLFTINHDKHTYHGQVFVAGDFYGLADNPKLQAGTGFSGLSDSSFTRMLKTKGIRIILLFKRKVQLGINGGPKAWFALQKQIQKGKEMGLYEKAEATKDGVLLVLTEREQGAKIQYLLPHYSLRGKGKLVCTVSANGETTAEFLFNDAPVKRERLQAGSQGRIVLDLQKLPMAFQFNHLEIRSGPSFELLKVRIE